MASLDSGRSIHSQLLQIDHSLFSRSAGDDTRPSSNIPSAFKQQDGLPPAHSVAYGEDRLCLWATYPTLGVITVTALASGRPHTRLLVPRGIIREPTSISFVSGVSDDEEGDLDVGCDALYVTDGAGCRIWRIDLGDDTWADTPKLVYQSYRSPTPALLLESSADYARDALSCGAQTARDDEGMQVRGVAVDVSRQHMFWLQGDCLMCSPLELDSDERPDQRRDVWVVEEDLHWVANMMADPKHRWLLLRDSRGSEARLFLGDLLRSEENSVTNIPLRVAESDTRTAAIPTWKDSAGEWTTQWTTTDEHPRDWTGDISPPSVFVPQGGCYAYLQATTYV